MDEFSITSRCKNIAVTSIKFLDVFILAGTGGDLCIFDTSDFKLKSTIKVFKNSVIHGISIEKHEKLKLCVFGGKHLAFLDIKITSSDLRLHCTRKLTISDWVSSCSWVSKDQLAILSAHNILSLWDSLNGTLLKQAVCSEKCLLYSSEILSNEGTGPVVLAGTVFQELIIWALDDYSTSQDQPVLHRLHGHKGVIFSVSYDERFRLISSTSDDRTVRVWSVNSPKEGNLTPEDWKEASVILSFSVFGHTARVWDSIILRDKTITSIGEDSTVCLWRYGGECISRREVHQGAGVWCMAVSEDLSLVATGGADGGVGLWPLEVLTEEVLSLTPLPDTPRRIALLLGQRIVVISQSGQLYLYTGKSWLLVFNDQRLSNYCLLEVSPSKQLLALASINGHIIILRGSDFTKIIDKQVSTSRIFSLHWLNEDTLLSCHDHGNVFIWKINNSELEELGQVHLPVYKERWTTSAVMCDTTVVYGDRSGNIHASYIVSSTHPLEDCVAAVKTVSRAHSRQGVCALHVFDGCVWSSGRDASVKRWRLADDQLTLVSTWLLPVDWISDIVQFNSLGLVVICFHQTHVQLWSVEERQKTMSLQCGGGHRSWSCLLEGDTFCFTFLKNKMAHVLMHPISTMARTTLLEGFHVREVNSMATLGEWVASGGEDGSVRVSRVTAAGWTTAAVAHSHISSVRSVHSTMLSDQLLLFSAGARAQLKVWLVDLDCPSGVSLRELCSWMLKAERRGRHWLDSSAPASDPETRFMDLHAIPMSDTTTMLLAASSDTFLRVFHFNIETKKLDLHSSARSGEHCLLRVSSFRCEGCDEEVAVTTSTGGQVAFWRVRGEVTAVGGEQLHCSGVNDLAVRPIGRSVLMATGGDDNKLSVCWFNVDVVPELTIKKASSWSCSTLHSSVITGVEIVGDWVVCCGGDQRVSLLSWSVSEGGDGLCVTMLSQYCCSVPDIKGLSVLQYDKEKFTFCVYGVGSEILEVNRQKKIFENTLQSCLIKP